MSTTLLGLGAEDVACGFVATELPMRLGEHERALRGGERTPPTPDPATLPRIPWVQIAAYRQRALSALRHEDLQQARRAVDRSVQLAREFGYGVLEAEGWQLAADVAWLQGDRAAVSHAAGALEGLGQSMPSPRFAGDARFARWLADVARKDVAALAELSRLRSVSPIAARRAQALLGLGERLDFVDAMVLARARANGWPPATPAVGDPARADRWWLLDESERCIWWSDGRRIDLSRREVPWQLVCALVERGGEASKEQLVLRVWPKAEYHPLRDDNRLKLGIKSLRRLVEPNPQHPVFIQTTSDGYALAVSLRVAKLSMQEDGHHSVPTAVRLRAVS